MRLFFALILCLLLATAIAAQEETQTPYEIALQRIEEARVSGATELDLSELGLEELPPEIGNLNQLLELNLRFNRLYSLPPEISNLNNLTLLDLTGSAFPDLPSELLQLSSLQELYLDRTHLREISPDIGRLTHLRVLWLRWNNISHLPPEIGNLRELRILRLEDNPLLSLPSEIGNLSELCHLDISDTSIQSLPAELGQLEKLRINAPCYNYLERGLEIDGTDLISPPPEVIAQGTPAILEYLRNQAWWHLQRLILGGAGFVSIVIIGIIGLRWRNNRRKGKKKNDL